MRSARVAAKDFTRKVENMPVMARMEKMRDHCCYSFLFRAETAEIKLLFKVTI